MTTFDITTALKIIGGIMKDEDITHEELLARFPQRPSTEAECTEVGIWMGQLIKARRAEAAAKTISFNPPTPSVPQVTLAEAQRNWVRKDKNGKNMPQYFAVEMDGKPHFFRVKPGYKSGVWFVEEQASDELYPVRQGERRGRILGLIFKNEQVAREMYARLIGRCSRCNRTLTDHDNPYFAAGLGPECGTK